MDSLLIWGFASNKGKNQTNLCVSVALQSPFQALTEFTFLHPAQVFELVPRLY